MTVYGTKLLTPVLLISEIISKGYCSLHQAESSYMERLWNLLSFGKPNSFPMRPLCDVCLSMFETIRSAPVGSWQGSKPRSFGYPNSSYLWAGSHHIQPESFLTSVKGGCYICFIVFRDCNESQRELARSFQIFYRFYKLHEEGIHDEMMRYGLRFGIEVEQNDKDVLGEFFYDCQGDFKLLPTKDIQPWVNDQQIPVNASDPRCLNLARTWLMDCVRSHKICQRLATDQGFYPTRLLNLGDTPGAASCRLQNCAIEHPNGPYCTLSHCWGRGEFVNLTMATLSELERGISIPSLSRTFQDAIKAVRSLGIRYLWIDALCIIQDSSEDWENEAARMSEIYAKSYCNIAATHAINGEGFFLNRAVCSVEPCPIDSSNFSKEPQGTYIIAYDDFWSINLRNAPLHRRGWVLQERLLSPRTIHFGNEQLFWECQHNTACESYPRGIPSQLTNPRAKAWRLFDSLLSERQAVLGPGVDERKMKLSFPYERWRETVEWYMECKISNPRDKLVAIAGIAHTVADVTLEPYLAGLWRNPYLAIQLLWHVLSRRQVDNSPSRRSDIYRAPSWSWACLEATIVWNWPATYDKILLSVVEVTIVPNSRDIMCEINYAALRVRGCLFEAKLEIARMRADGTHDEDGDYNLLVDYEEIYEDGTILPVVFSIAGLAVHLDTALMPTPKRTVYCLPACTEWAGKPGTGAFRIAGLLLVQSPQMENQYSRIGIFGLDTVDACHFCGLDTDESHRLDEVLFSMPLQTITVI